MINSFNGCEKYLNTTYMIHVYMYVHIYMSAYHQIGNFRYCRFNHILCVRVLCTLEPADFDRFCYMLIKLCGFVALLAFIT